MENIFRSVLEGQAAIDQMKRELAQGIGLLVSFAKLFPAEMPRRVEIGTMVWEIEYLEVRCGFGSRIEDTVAFRLYTLPSNTCILSSNNLGRVELQWITLIHKSLEQLWNTLNGTGLFKDYFLPQLLAAELARSRA